MLMRMGWEEGKGLGKDEDGSTRLLEIEYKVDNVGMWKVENTLSL